MSPWMAAKLRAVACIFGFAAIGAGVGLALSIRGVLQHGYPGIGFWRTSLWLSAQGADRGAAVGLAAGGGVLLLFHLILRTFRRPFPRLPSTIRRRLGYVIAGRAARAGAGLVLLLTVALGILGWATLNHARAQASRRGRSIILIGIDTLRADCTCLNSPGEHSRALTPNLQAFGAHGTVFSNAVAQAPWTLASFASVVTGLYPGEHGAEHLTSTLAPPQTTLAEVLREAGYRTLGVVSGEYVTTSAGMAQGFEVFDESQVQGGTGISSNAVTDKAIELLRGHGHEPFFLFLHYFDPHWIYQDHKSYDFADGYSGRLREPAATMKQSEFQEYLGTGRPGFGRKSLSDEEITFLRGLYYEDVAHTDEALGRLFAFLDDAGLLDSCLVILVADHGEAFLEHGRLGHNNSLFAEETHVPLMIVGPSVDASRVVDSPVETRDVFSTVLAWVGVPPPAGRQYPDPLLGPVEAAPALVRSAGYTMVLGMEGRMLSQPVECWWTSVQDGRWKLIKEHLRGRSMLFDLENDPGETRNCQAENPDCRRRLERELDRLDDEVRGRAPRTRVPEASEEQQRRLKSLGYL